MRPVRIVGIGSWSGDDRIGWDAVEAIRASSLLRRLPSGMVEVCRCDRPGGLLALGEGARALVLVDAMRSGAAPGTVRRVAEEELARQEQALSSHGMGIAQYLALGRVLGLLPPAVVLYGIEAGRTAPASGPARSVRAAIPGLLRLLEDELARLVRAA